MNETKTLTISEFLRERLSEDHAEALLMPADEDGYGTHIHCPDREFVLEDIMSKRSIVDLHKPDRALENWYWPERRCAECGGFWHDSSYRGEPPTVIGPERGCPTLRLLAVPYRRHEDYREEWA